VAGHDQESHDQDVDDEFRRLLEGLRTTLPGAQVLLGFLLIVPFQAGFAELSSMDRSLYLVTFFSSAIASVLLIAPSAHQRFRAPMDGIRRSTASHVRAAVWVSLVGTVFLGVAMGAAVALIGSVVDAGWGVTVGWAAVAVALAYSWVLQPLVLFRRDGADG